MSLTADQPIGVFDSGVGGLTVLKALHTVLPHETYVYMGDTARTPYGTKSLSLVQSFAAEISGYLLARRVKMVVIACNTASAAAAEMLRATLPVPVIDVITPTVSAALGQAEGPHTLGVIGTAATVRSGLYQKAIHDAGHEVWAKACPLLAPMVEEGLWDDPVAQKVVEHYLENCPQNLQSLILGCTHYPMLAPLLGRLLPGVQLIDSAHATAHAARNKLADMGLLNTAGQGAVHHVVTGDVKSYQLMASRFLFPAALVNGMNIADLPAYGENLARHRLGVVENLHG